MDNSSGRYAGTRMNATATFRPVVRACPLPTPASSSSIIAIASRRYNTRCRRVAWRNRRWQFLVEQQFSGELVEASCWHLVLSTENVPEPGSHGRRHVSTSRVRRGWRGAVMDSFQDELD